MLFACFVYHNPSSSAAQKEAPEINTFAIHNPYEKDKDFKNEQYQYEMVKTANGYVVKREKAFTYLKEKWNWEEFVKPLYKALGVLGGFIIVLIILFGVVPAYYASKLRVASESFKDLSPTERTLKQLRELQIKLLQGHLDNAWPSLRSVVGYFFVFELKAAKPQFTLAVVRKMAAEKKIREDEVVFLNHILERINEAEILETLNPEDYLRIIKSLCTFVRGRKLIDFSRQDPSEMMSDVFRLS